MASFGGKRDKTRFLKVTLDPAAGSVNATYGGELPACLANATNADVMSSSEAPNNAMGTALNAGQSIDQASDSVVGFCSYFDLPSRTS